MGKHSSRDTRLNTCTEYVGSPADGPEGPAQLKDGTEGGSIENNFLLRGDFCHFITLLQPPPPREAAFTNTSFMKFKELAAAQS